MLRHHDPSKPANMTARDRQNEVVAILTRGLCRLRPARQKNSEKPRKRALSCWPTGRSM